MKGQAISFRGVCKGYAKQRVLTGINLGVNQGEYLGLVGVNGAGKTTLIKCMLDFTCIESGAITIFDTRHTTNSARKNLAYLPERFIPPYYLTGRDFLAYMADLHQQSYDPVKTGKMLAVLDLDKSALEKPVRQFSKGMSQKLGIAACLLSNKELLIMDEPLSGLDPKAMAFLKQHLINEKKQGKTVFFSTHQLSDVETLCDRVAILHDGRIRFAGPPGECCARFATDDFEEAYLQCIETAET
ncbi:MAG: ABC transporter ATP-binding protein [Gammaproteobacteria bacterium]